MRIAKSIVSLALLSISAAFGSIAAHADSIQGELVIKGTGTLSSSGVLFSPTNGQVKTTGTQGFSTFTATTQGTYSNFSFSGFPLGDTEAGALFYAITEGGKTLDLYITEIDSLTIGRTTPTPAKAGAFSGLGYVTLTGVSGDLPVSVEFLDTTNGTGSKIFTVTIDGLDPPIADTPEPSSLVLLGTGVLGMAGAARRKLFRS